MVRARGSGRPVSGRPHRGAGAAAPSPARPETERETETPDGPVVIGLTFLAIFVVELPDKTFLATLVLATIPPILVWIGVGSRRRADDGRRALGHAVSFLPREVVQRSRVGCSSRAR